MELKIFIIEDDLLVVENIKEIADSLGYRVSGFSSKPSEAIEMIKVCQPDIVIVDINLNGKMDGLNLSKVITQELNLPVIFLTAYSEKSLVNEALKNFPYAYLIKPVREEELEIALKLTYAHFQLSKTINSQKEWFEDIVDFAGSMILIISNDQKAQYVNKRGCEILGYDKDEVIGKNWFDNFIPTEIRESLRTLFLNGLEVGEKTLDYFENEVLTASGKRKLIAWNNRHYFDESGRVQGYICTGEDITEKRSIEENLLLTLFAIDNAGDGIVWIDEIGKIKFINKTAANLLGHKPFDLIDKSFPTFLLTRNINSIDKFVSLIKTLGSLSYEVLVWNEDKGASFYRVKANTFSYKKNLYVFFHLHDVTLEVTTREEIKTLSMVVEQSPVAIIITDNTGKIKYINQSFTEITGYNLNEVIGKTPAILKSGLQNEKDYKVLWKTILSGKIWNGVFQNKKKDGEIFWAKASIFPIFDDKGKILHFVAEEEDITEEKRAKDSLQKTLEELGKLNKELDAKVVSEVRKNIEREKLLIQQSRFAAMGEMLGNIAHQWRQPLNAVGILLQNLYFNYKKGRLEDDYFNKTVEKTMDLLKYMSRTIDDFRNFFKPDKEVEEFYISDLVKKSISLIKGSFENKGIKIEIQLKDEIKVKGFSNQLGQVLLNILNNAYDALIEKDIKNPFIQIKLLRINKKAILSISNNGGRIPKEIMEKIFDPYFTTKEKGSGIGLYMSKIIVENYFKGKLIAENLEDGVEFSIELPV